MRCVIPLILTLLFAACSSNNVLDEVRAKAMISEAFKNAQYQAPIDDIAALMGRSNIDYSKAEGKIGSSLVVHDLLEAGLVTQTEKTVTYPNLSGTWQARSGKYTFIFNLVAVQGTNRVTGTCQTDHAPGLGKMNGLQTTNITGSIDPANDVTIQGNLACSGSYSFTKHFQFTQDASGAYLREKDEAVPRTFAISKPMAPLEVRWYTYTFAPTVTLSSQRVDASPGEILVSGRFEKVRQVAGVGTYDVGDVSNLQLVDPTHASAEFTFGVAYNKLGSIVRKNVKVDGHGQASFVQKPDQTWVIAGIKQ